MVETTPMPMLFALALGSIRNVERSSLWRRCRRQRHRLCRRCERSAEIAQTTHNICSVIYVIFHNGNVVGAERELFGRQLPAAYVYIEYAFPDDTGLQSGALFRH